MTGFLSQKKTLIISFLIFTCLFFSTKLFAEESITTITIMNARETSYKKADDTGNDTIILEGSVVLSVQKDDTTTEIKADRITYDRSTKMLYAEGNVEILTKSSSSGGETTTAKSLLMNTSTLEGVFDGGRVVQTKSDALNLPSGSTLIVFADILGKGNSNIISFKNSTLTFCDDESPHWHIDATRTWLLPGGEFAFFNALLYVGVVPVLYFPIFYYPKDELVFNPVFGYGNRTGFSIQTTTYLWGRKPLESSSDSSSSEDSSTNESTSAESLKALYNFVKPSALKEQKLEGIVLHNLDTDYKGDTSHYVKFMADWYSNLGMMVGLQGNLQPSKNYITKLNFEFDLGFSETVFKNNGTYHPFSSTGNTYKDSSTFLGKTLPFRYGGNLELALSKPFSLSLSLPIYSDPYFASDFLTNRVETMEWISYFLDKAQTKKETPDEKVTEISSYSWKLAASYSPSIPQVLAPYVASFSVSYEGSVKISSIDATNMLYERSPPKDYSWYDYSPMRRFYYPELVTPAKINSTIKGTIFQWPPKVTSSYKTPEYIITPHKPDELKTPEQLKEENSENAENIITSEKTENAENQDTPLFEYNIPDIEFAVEKNPVQESITYALTYSLGTEITTQLAYSSENLTRSEDFEWDNVRSYMYKISVPATLTSQFVYGGGFLAVQNNLSYNPVFQKHPFVCTDTTKGGYAEEDEKKLYLADYQAENRDVINSNTITVKPLMNVDILSDSSIDWNSSIKVFRKEFTGTADNPEWDVYGIDWGDEKCITVNSLSATLLAKEYNNLFSQKLTFTSIMPPLLKQYNAKLDLTFPYVTFSLGTGFQEVSETNQNKKWKKNPLQQTLQVSFLDSKLKFSEAYTYNLEEKENDNLKLSSSYAGLSLTYIMANTYGYDFDSLTGWTIRNKKEFLPYSLSFSYAPATKTYYKWFNRISVAPGLNASIVADLLKPTSSYLTFSPSLSFKITEFLDITFSATSRNSVLYWYFHDGMYDEWGGFPGNMIKDLIDSFRFDDKTKRQGSGFKLKSLNMAITHDLHDWKFNMTMKVEPRLIKENNQQIYDFKPYITIGVVWNPMESIKTSIVDEYGEWKLE